MRAANIMFRVSSLTLFHATLDSAKCFPDQTDQLVIRVPDVPVVSFGCSLIYHDLPTVNPMIPCDVINLPIVSSAQCDP